MNQVQLHLGPGGRPRRHLRSRPPRVFFFAGAGDATTAAAAATGGGRLPRRPSGPERPQRTTAATVSPLAAATSRVPVRVWLPRRWRDAVGDATGGAVSKTGENRRKTLKQLLEEATVREG